MHTTKNSLSERLALVLPIQAKSGYINYIIRFSSQYTVGERAISRQPSRTDSLNSNKTQSEQEVPTTLKTSLGEVANRYRSRAEQSNMNMNKQHEQSKGHLDIKSKV